MQGAHKKALVIGISNYSHLQTLDICKNDGIDMYEVLSSLDYEISDENNLIGEAKGEKIKDAIDDFFSDSNSKPDDTLLFYYSGHGIPDVYGDIYLASSDIDPNEPHRKGFSFEELTKRIQRTTSTKVVVILDSCYSGSAKLSKGDGESAAKLGMTAIEEQSKKLQGQGKYILSASQALQEAIALTTDKHSLFTNYILQGLKGDPKSIDNEGNVTPESLGMYAYREIMSLPADKRSKQKPITRADGSANIVLASYPKLKSSKVEDDQASMLNLLREGKVEEFNKRREKNSKTPLDFSMENLHGIHIPGANLSSANLRRTNLSASDLEGADISNADLSRADLEGSNLSKANFSNVVLESTNLSNANLTRSNLSNANLTRSNLSNANLFSADLQQAKLIGTDLRGTILTEANLNGADLRGAIFEEGRNPIDIKDISTAVTSDAKKDDAPPTTMHTSSPVMSPIRNIYESDKEIGAPIKTNTPIIQKKLEPNGPQKPISKDSLSKKDLDSTQVSDNDPSAPSTRPITNNSIYNAVTKADETTIHKGILEGRTKIFVAVLAAVAAIGVILSLTLFFHFNHLSTATTIASNSPNQTLPATPKTPGNQTPGSNQTKPTIPKPNSPNQSPHIIPKTPPDVPLLSLVNDTDLQRYAYGWNDGAIACNSGHTIPEINSYLLSDNYTKHHTEMYHQGYGAALAHCKNLFNSNIITPNPRIPVPFLSLDKDPDLNRYDHGWNDGAIACNDDQTIPEINSYLLSDDYTKHHTDMYHQGYGAALAHCNIHIDNVLAIENSNP